MLEFVIKSDPIPTRIVRSNLLAVPRGRGTVQRSVFHLLIRAAVHFILPLKLDDPLHVLSLLSPREMLGRGCARLSTRPRCRALGARARLRESGRSAAPPRLACDFEPGFTATEFSNRFAARHAGRAVTTMLAIGATLPVEPMVTTRRGAGASVLQKATTSAALLEPFDELPGSPRGVGADVMGYEHGRHMCHCYDETRGFSSRRSTKTSGRVLRDKSRHCAQLIAGRSETL